MKTKVMDETKQHSWARRALAEQPTILVSIVYLIASLIGLLYSWAFLRGFDINVFRYADMSDFLLASLKEPFTWALAILAVIMVALDNTMSLRVQRRGPSRYLRWYASERYRQSNYLVLLFLIVVFLFSYAATKGREIRNGKGEVLTVSLKDSSSPKQLVLLGTTARFVFLYDPKAERVDIHPNESILTMSKFSPDS